MDLVSMQSKNYDFHLKLLLVGDSDVGKEEMLNCLTDGATASPAIYSVHSDHNYKTTTLLLDGKRVKLQLWSTSGQGRFCTILRSYSRGAQGIILVYDITSRWSFAGLDRWLKEIEEHAPGIPKILVGNRCHLAFKREVSEVVAEEYAAKNGMSFFEVSPLCDFNVTESVASLARVALQRNGMSRSLGFNRVLTLQEMCFRAITKCTTVYSVELLPLPTAIKVALKSYLMMNHSVGRRVQSFQHKNRHKKHKIVLPSDSPPRTRATCVVS